MAQLQFNMWGNNMKALISPNEKVYNYDDPPVEVGVRVAEISAVEFPVCDPLFWVDCSDEVTDHFYYNGGSFYPAPVKPQPPIPPEATAETGPVVI